MRFERHDIHGGGTVDCPVYDMRPKPDYWAAVTDVPCPVRGCRQTVLWFEAGYVPGYRVCMARVTNGSFDADSLHHRFLAGGDTAAPTLIRDLQCEC